MGHTASNVKRPEHSDRTRILEETRSLCPTCLRIIPATLYSEDNRVYMQKTCGEHGFFKSLIWSDLALYRRALSLDVAHREKPADLAMSKMEKGCPYDCGLCPDHKQHTCLAILEITDGCQLQCPICYAASRIQPSFNPTVKEIENALHIYKRSKGRAGAIQLSGGEPLTRRDIVEVVKAAETIGFGRIEVDTNGVALAKKPELAKDLAEAGLTGVVLQFDGLSDEVYAALRGSNLLKIKLSAIENAVKANLQVTLAATVVKGLNSHNLWDLVRFAVEKRLLGVIFQPVAFLGRYPRSVFNPCGRETLSDVMLDVERQSGGMLKAEDFVSIPCPDSRCSALVYASVSDGRIQPLSRLVDSGRLVSECANMANKISSFNEMLDAITDLTGGGDAPVQCQCGSTAAKAAGFMSIGCHAAQDVYNVDLERLMKCCIHQLTMDGELIPFCLYSLTSSSGEPLYRAQREKKK